MNREQARDILKGYLRSYLEEVHSVNVQRPFRCLNPEHKDEHPSMGFDKAHNRVHCFSCGFSADIIDLIKQDNNLTTDREAFALGYQRYGIDVDEDISRHTISSYRQSEIRGNESTGRGMTDFALYFSGYGLDTVLGHSRDFWLPAPEIFHPLRQRRSLPQGSLHDASYCLKDIFFEDARKFGRITTHPIQRVLRDDSVQLR